MTVKAQDIATLVEMFEASKWDELHVEIDGLHLFLSIDPKARLTSGDAPAPAAIRPGTSASEPQANPTPAPLSERQASAPAAAEGPVPSSWVPVTAPNLGTFYRAPKPGAAPFVEVGQKVDDTMEICLLEVMKLFTAVRAGTAGIVRKICVADAQMVEFGETLFYIEPA